jgi:hypothetical protein
MTAQSDLAFNATAADLAGRAMQWIRKNASIRVMDNGDEKIVPGGDVVRIGRVWYTQDPGRPRGKVRSSDFSSAWPSMGARRGNSASKKRWQHAMGPLFGELAPNE